MQWRPSEIVRDRCVGRHLPHIRIAVSCSSTKAHTRGTDLKLPDHYRAAVTLGPGMTKDTLVQACMRTRKLGQGQSVTFIVSPEMRKRIRVIRNITDGRALIVRHVLAWAISESWDEAARSVPLWATQGKRHLRQEEIWNQADDPGGFPHAAVKEYLEPEAMSLDHRDRPTSNYDQNLLSNSLASLSLHPLAAISQKLCAFSDSTLTTPSSTLQEEQERDRAPETEEERQVSRPPPRQALKHIMHPDVKLYILTGDIPPKTLMTLITDLRPNAIFCGGYNMVTAPERAFSDQIPPEWALRERWPCPELCELLLKRCRKRDRGPRLVGYMPSTQWYFNRGVDS